MPRWRKSRTRGCAASARRPRRRSARARARLASITSSSRKMSSDGQRRAAGERVAGVGVRVQEAARDVVVPEGVVHLVGGQHARQRQVAARDALGEQQEVGRDARLLAGEQRSRAPEPGHDLVGDQVHLVARAELAGAHEVVRVVHRHARGALHQRLDDQRGGRRVVLREVRFERPRRALGARRAADSPGRAGRASGRGHRAPRAQQRRIGVAEQRHVGDRQRAERLAVVAAGEAHEAALVAAARGSPRRGSSS